MTLTVAGYDGSPLSPAALKAVSQAALVVGGRRHLDAVELPERADTVVMGGVDLAMEAVQTALDAGRHTVVLASGDPGFFGIVRRLQGLRLAERIVVLPAVSSVAAAFGRLGLPWDDAVVVSAHGRPLRPALHVLRRYGHGPGSVAVLTDDDSSPARILQALGEDCPVLIVLERLGTDGERVTTVLTSEPDGRGLYGSGPDVIGPDGLGPDVIGPAEALARAWQAPNLVVTAGVGRPGAAPWLLGRPAAFGPAGWALPDDSFVHRDGMITKRDVRAAVLARLGPTVGELVWDIGSGSGSVAVECSRLGAAAVAVERDELACGLIAQNAAMHAAPVKVVQGSAPEALAGLPMPDAVFVGGGGPDVVAAVAALRPARVVVALATIERVGPTVAALQGYTVDTVLVQVQHLQPLGEGHRLVPANPVFVVSGALQ